LLFQKKVFGGKKFVFLPLFFIKNIFLPLFIILFHSNLFCNNQSNKSSFCKKTDKTFHIIIPSYNAKNICEKTLQSILDQTYQKYRVYYLDDGSTDDTIKIAKNFLKNQSLENRKKFILKKFYKNKGSVERLYQSICSLKDKDIVIYFEGNCFFPKKDILQKLNEKFTKNNAWLVYGQDIELSSQKKGVTRFFTSQNLFTNSMRWKNWKRARIKSFYVGLFKKIKVQDLFFRAKFISEIFDSYYMFPLMEMTPDEKICFIKKPIISYSKKDEFIDKKRSCNKSYIKCKQRLIRATPYSEINHFITEYKVKKEDKIDIVIFSNNRPMQLYALLESINKYVKNFNKISVIYKTNNNKFLSAYSDVKRNFTKVQFLKQNNKFVSDFKTITSKAILSNKNDAKYIVFAVDDVIIKDYIDLSKCIEAIKQTNGYFFSMRLGKNINYYFREKKLREMPHNIKIAPNIICWHLNSAQGDWKYFGNFDMTIYSKEVIKEIFDNFEFDTPHQLVTIWNQFAQDYPDKKKKIGLSFSNSKCINIPCSMMQRQSSSTTLFTSEDLLRKYNNGFKIDIDTFFQIKNNSVYMDEKPIFVERNIDQESVIR
jgi:glycosyltransferase involved in cell wall biosynthesis